MAKAIAKKDQSSALDILDDAIATTEEEQGFISRSVFVGINHASQELVIPGLPAMAHLETLVLAARKYRVFYPRFPQDADTQEIIAWTGKRPFCMSRNYQTGELWSTDEDIWEKAPEGAVLLKGKIAEGLMVCGRAGSSTPHCPLNDWDSMEYMGHAEGTPGKACHEKRELLCWKPGLVVPVVLRVPTSSIRLWDEYCSNLSAAELKHRDVVTDITLEKKESPGREWSVCKFRMVDRAPEEMLTDLIREAVGPTGKRKMLALHLIDTFRGRDVTPEDAENGDSERAGEATDNF